MELKNFKHLNKQSNLICPFLVSLIFYCFYFLFNFYWIFVLHWLIKFYRFHEYNSIIQPLYIVLCVHHTKSSFFSSPFKPPFNLFYLLPPPFHSGNHLLSVFMSFFFFLLNPFTYFMQPHSMPSDSCETLLYLWICFCFVCLLYWLLSIFSWASTRPFFLISIMHGCFIVPPKQSSLKVS